MAQQFTNENSGALFKNSRKEEGSKQPDYTGNGNFGGVDFEVSAWLKEGKNGKFLSLAFREPFKKEAKEPAKANGYQPGQDEDIPF